MVLIGVTEAARRLKLSTARVVQLNREGTLAASRDSANRRQFDAAVVDALAVQRAARRQEASIVASGMTGRESPAATSAA
jgi:DNA-binding transcriptional MerR regulator